MTYLLKPPRSDSHETPLEEETIYCYFLLTNIQAKAPQVQLEAVSSCLDVRWSKIVFLPRFSTAHCCTMSPDSLDHMPLGVPGNYCNKIGRAHV